MLQTCWKYNASKNWLQSTRVVRQDCGLITKAPLLTTTSRVGFLLLVHEQGKIKRAVRGTVELTSPHHYLKGATV